MLILNAPAAALAWLGRQGTRALAVSIFFGLAVPSLAVYVKPYLGATVFVLPPFSHSCAPSRRPSCATSSHRCLPSPPPSGRRRRCLCCLGWSMSFPVCAKDFLALYTIMILQIAMAPIPSLAAFAAIMALDVEFTLLDADHLQRAVAINQHRLHLPLPRHVAVLSDRARRRAVFLDAASGAAAFAIRRIAGQHWIERRKDHIDGLNVIAVFRLRHCGHGERAAPGDG